MKKDLWPALYFGPVNLWTIVSAVMFYSSREEQEEMIWRERTSAGMRRPPPAIRAGSPASKKIFELIALR